MGPEAIAQLLTEYGLPVALTILFIILYKGQNDRQTKFLFKTISELNDKEEYISDLKRNINANTALLEKLRNTIIDFNDVIRDCLQKRDK